MSMKRILLIPLALVASSALAMSTQIGGTSLTLTATTDSLNNNKVAIEVRNVEVDGQMVQDTISITAHSDAEEAEVLDQKPSEPKKSRTVNFVDTRSYRRWPYEMWVFVLPMLIVIIPLLIVALALYFRYKNRQSRYRLIAKALESGQPLPKELQDEAKKAFRQSNPQQESLNQLRSKGIGNVATGLGLFILLWALTDSFAIGCVGLLVLCIGLGKLVNYHLQMKDAQFLRDKCAEQSSPEPEHAEAEEVRE